MEALHRAFQLRPMTIMDLFDMNNINLDPFTENFHPTFYMDYLLRWPECCFVAVSGEDNTLVGYLIGKMETTEKEYYGHVSAVSVSPSVRGYGLGRVLMREFEARCWQDRAKFVDLFVRQSNAAAVDFYDSLGYWTHRVLERYYGSEAAGTEEDAMEMRKNAPDQPLKRFKQHALWLDSETLEDSLARRALEDCVPLGQLQELNDAEGRNPAAHLASDNASVTIPKIFAAARAEAAKNQPWRLPYSAIQRNGSVAIAIIEEGEEDE